jgi:hypothetical protein
MTNKNDPCYHTNQGYDHIWLYWILRKKGICIDIAHKILGTFLAQSVFFDTLNGRAKFAKTVYIQMNSRSIIKRGLFKRYRSPDRENCDCFKKI